MNLRLTIRNKLLLATCFILLVSYAILVHTTIRSINGFTEDQLSRQLNENLLFAKEQYVSRADKIRYSLQQPASSPPVQQWIVNRDIGSLKESVQRWRTILSFAEYVALVDADQYTSIFPPATGALPSVSQRRNAAYSPARVAPRSPFAPCRPVPAASEVRSSS